MTLDVKDNEILIIVLNSYTEPFQQTTVVLG